MIDILLSAISQGRKVSNYSCLEKELIKGESGYLGHAGLVELDLV